MNLERLPYSPDALVNFFDEALSALGALCERTWHDRLEIVAEGRAAQMWNPEGNLHELELRFPPAEDTSPREAAKEVFPGCPLTFQLCEALRRTPLALERLVLAGETAPRPPAADVAERLWRAQSPQTNRWRLATPFAADLHFSLVALMRCEIQAIDQHWSLRRLAVSLPDGSSDDALAQAVPLLRIANSDGSDIAWPTPEPARWREYLSNALEKDLASSLALIRDRQSRHLRRELDRVDDYFEHYEQELTTRHARQGSENTQSKAAERLAAARAEHARRRADQVARHEIRALAHLEALLITAEPAWRTTLAVELAHNPRTLEVQFVPRSRRWIVPGT
jgi:hypothetical protein